MDFSWIPVKAVAIGTALLLLGIWAVCRLAHDLPRRSRTRPLGELARREEGATAMLDFILVFPFFAIIVLIVIQLALLINARLMVSYSAYTAARAAIVWLHEGDEIAYEKAAAAARISCTPISPGNISILRLGGFAAGLRIAPLMAHTDWGDNLRRIPRAGSKFLYSQLATDVSISPSSPGPREPVTVSVTHQFHLNVPYAAGIFADLSGASLIGIPTVSITDSYTLLNEGKVVTQ